jgi:thiamine kinase-like enzyme
MKKNGFAITNHDTLKKYLIEKELISESEPVEIETLSGGVSGDVVRVSMKGKSLVIKQALEKLKVKADWFSDPRRISTEINCLEVYHQLIAEHVPELYFHDEENHLYGMEAAPIGSEMWKVHLLQGRIDLNIAQKAVRALAQVHDQTANDVKAKERFKDKTIFYELRIEPYFETTMNKHVSLRKYYEGATDILMEEKSALVHGDFSPKNILVHGNKILIIDFEVAHFGAPSFDIAFFINHFMLKAVKNKQWSEAYLNAIKFMIAEYKRHCARLDWKELEEQSVPMLACLFLARVDGKSPAEYITREEDKLLIRKISSHILLENFHTFEMVTDYCKMELALFNEKKDGPI